MFINTSSCVLTHLGMFFSKHLNMFSNTPLDFLTYLDVFSNTSNKVISIKFVFPKAKTVNY